MERISLNDLEAVVRRINRTVNGTDETPVWFRDGNGNGELHQSPDVYALSGAYGGYALHRASSADADGQSRGASDVFHSGHIPKRDLYERMQAFLCGVDAAREAR